MRASGKRQPFIPGCSPGLDIKSMLENHEARPAVMLQENVPRLSWRLREACRIYPGIPLCWLVFLPGQNQRCLPVRVLISTQHSPLICFWQDLRAGDRPPSDGDHPRQWSMAGPAQSQAWPVQGNTHTHTCTLSLTHFNILQQQNQLVITQIAFFQPMLLCHTQTENCDRIQARSP